MEELYTDVEEVTCPECGHVFDLTIQGDSKHKVNGDDIQCPECFEIVIPVKRSY